MEHIKGKLQKPVYLLRFFSVSLWVGRATVNRGRIFLAKKRAKNVFFPLISPLSLGGKGGQGVRSRGKRKGAFWQFYVESYPVFLTDQSLWL